MDVPTRVFHWLNALLVIALIGTALVIYNGDALGISADGKILLKSVHVSFGYVMALNLLWRLRGRFSAIATRVGAQSSLVARDICTL